MTHISANDPLVTALRVEDVTALLAYRHWQRVDSPNDRLLVFQSPPDERGRTIRLVLPASDEYEDRSSRIADAVSLLAELEDVEPSRLLQRITLLNRDILRVKLSGPTVKAGGVPLKRVVSIVNSLSELMAFAACAEEQPLPAFEKMRSIGRHFAEKCLFGHTFHGSFGFNIETPVPPKAPDAPAEEAPFERRVTTRVVHGLQELRSAVQGGDPAPLEADFKTGMNANMCEALASIADAAGDSVVSISADWSPQIPPPSGLLRPPPVELGTKAVEFLGLASRRLRSGRQATAMKVVGRVVRLDAVVPPVPDALDATSGRSVVIESDRLLRVHVPLDIESYRLACDAHRDGRRVSVEGTLEKIGKFWTLLKPHGFTVEG